MYTFVEAAPGLVTKSTSTSTSTRGTDDVVDVGASVNAKIPKPRAAAAAAAAEVSKIVPRARQEQGEICPARAPPGLVAERDRIGEQASTRGVERLSQLDQDGRG